MLLVACLPTALSMCLLGGRCSQSDEVRKHDSFNAFEEILQTARARNVDALFLGGDLFHDNKPTRRAPRSDSARPWFLRAHHCEPAGSFTLIKITGLIAALKPPEAAKAPAPACWALRTQRLDVYVHSTLGACASAVAGVSSAPLRRSRGMRRALPPAAPRKPLRCWHNARNFAPGAAAVGLLRPLALWTTRAFTQSQTWSTAVTRRASAAPGWLGRSCEQPP